MRLGGPIFTETDSPESWARAVRAAGYRAAYCPLGPMREHDDATVRAYAQAAADADITIAEVGGWSNPISPDDATRAAAIETCQRALDLAERIGARCAVNITGSRGEHWAGPHADDLTDATFGLIVDSVREIVDAVRPSRAVYALETMPWMYPDSADSYLALLAAIDRPAFTGVHLDPVNLINCPSRYFDNTALLRECFAKLGPQIRSCHAKDIQISKTLTLHLDEVCPGQGSLDYRTYLRELDRLHPDTPIMTEHLPDPAAYEQAAAHIRSVADAEGLAV